MQTQVLLHPPPPVPVPGALLLSTLDKQHTHPTQSGLHVPSFDDNHVSRSGHRNHTPSTSPQRDPHLVSNTSRPTSPTRHHRTRPMSSSHSSPRPATQTEPSAHSSSSSSPRIRPAPLFPSPHSAPHHLNHFSPSETSCPPNMDHYPMANLAHRYLRVNDKYSHNQHPMLDQRRMSEPAMYGSAASGYPSNTADLSAARYQLQSQLSYVSPPSYPSHSPSPLIRSSTTRSLSASSWKEDHQLPLHHYDPVDLEEPLSPLNPTFSGGESSPPMGMSGVMFGSLHEDYGPSPPGTGTSTASSNAPPVHQHPNSIGGPGSPSNAKQYSFVSLPGNGVKKRPRRRYDEIERLYQCSWQSCTKSYGTLNHLNAHITMQKHGSKRSPNEFKELRKQWRKAKKEEAEARALEGMRHGSHQHQHPSQHSSRHPMPDADYQTQNIRPPFDYARHPERTIQPIAPLDDLHDPLERDVYSRRSQRYGSFVAPHPQHSGMVYPHSQAHGPNAPTISVNRLPANSTLLTPLPGYEPSSIGSAPDFDVYNSYDLYRSDSRSRTGSGSPGRHSDRGRPRSSHHWSQS